jgi:hypothetical protein
MTEPAPFASIGAMTLPQARQQMGDMTVDLT